MSAEALYQLVQDGDINWIQVHITDLYGGLRVVHFPAKRFLESDILSSGFGFDGSSVGFKSVEKSDMIAIPDPESFRLLPHEADEALIRADLFETDGSPCSGDPRQMLKAAVASVKKAGFDAVKFSPEMEFHCFAPDVNGTEGAYGPRANNGYFVAPPSDDVKEYRKELSEMLLEMNYPVKYHHHECGASQHEVEITGLDAVSAADFCVLFKFLARELASLYGIQVTFMPKPVADEAGNGMHAHMLFEKDGKNAFFDETDSYRLSQTARYFIGGVLDHSAGLAAIANPIVNSYKRLVPNYEAPIYIAWAGHNRTSLIRIAAKKNVDVEVRNADPAANIYLFYAGLLHAGLDGIAKKTSYEPIERNIYAMSDEQIAAHNIRRMPEDLPHALEALESDEVLLKSLGADAMRRYIDGKRLETREFNAQITEADFEFFFNC